MAEMDTFQIIFMEGVDYVASTHIEQQSFKNIIKQSFCLLSWMIPDYQIRIKYESLIGQNSKVKVFTKRNVDEYYSIHERKMDRCVYYALGCHGKKDDFEAIMKEAIDIAKQDESIKVEFVNQQTISYFSIIAQCKQSAKAGSTFRDIFLNQSDKKPEQPTKRYNYFKPPCRPSGKSKPSLSNVKYYFIQPENRRYYEPEGYHLNLAFQGGGAKGVSYVGVNRAIKTMQERILKESNGEIQLPIRSVIGSSAGGILSLAISAGISDEDLTDLCYMMDTLVSDRLFSTTSEVDNAEENPTQFNEKYDDNISPQFFSNQDEAIKNLLHNLGITQNSLTQILFETLKEPSVQQRLMAVFKAVNPSIAELMSFKDEPQSYAEGESIKGCLGTCCCCCYSNCCWNCCGCYPCCQTFPGSGCFIEKESKCKKINIYGLLYAALMTGSAVENILAYALSMFLEIQADNKSQKLVEIAVKRRWFNFSDSERILLTISKEAKSLRNSYKSSKDYLQNILMSFSKELTLKQYYGLIGVEFTCTSVDLNDKIQRFFNHKTTPNLPICKAVQMTGSFPAAFLSLKWKKEWGKYYIHYDTSRRQIDLTSHHFTDGGLLANFPLKFLDNEKFRQKYFSHMNVEKKTLLYGFGLDQLDEFPEVDNSEQVNAAIASLVQQFKYRLIYKMVFYLMSCGTKQTLPNEKVKLFDFLLSLLDALRESDRNLNKECFEEEIVQTTIDKKPIESIQELNALKEPVKNLLRNLEEKIESHFKKSQDIFLRDEFSAIYQRFYDFDKACRQGQTQLQKIFNRRLKWHEIQSIQITLQDNILIYSNASIDIYQKRMRDLQQEYSHVNVLMTSSTNHHQFQILQLLYDLKIALMKLPLKQFDEIKKSMKGKCSHFFVAVKDVYERVFKTINNPQRHNNAQPVNFIGQKDAISLLHLKNRITPYIRKNYINFEKSFDMTGTSPIMSYYVQEQTYFNRVDIMNQIKGQIYQKILEISQKDRKLKRPSTIQTHIVFQANNFSHYYFPNYIKMVEEVISVKGLKIDIISCTDYHAIFGVFYALGYDFGNTKKQLWQVHSLFQQSKDIEQTYNNKQWMKTSVETVRSLLENQWKKTQDPFELIENEYDLLNSSNRSLSKKEATNMFNNIANQFEVSQQTMSGAFEKILDYISGSFAEIQKLSSHQRRNRFQQLLNLGSYKKINQSQSKNGVRVFNHLLDYTVNLLMLTSEYIIKSQQFSLFSSKNWSKQLIFKGMVINSLISSFKYRVFIYNTLVESGLDQNITLQKFYEVSEKKVLLNFNCVNTTQQRFSLINKITKPNMPLWAALMACASLPYHEGDFDSIKQWETKGKNDRFNLQKADIIFKNYQAQGKKRGNSYICGNFIASLPLEFMTNQRLIESKLVEPKPYQFIEIIEIVFAFDVKISKKNEEDLLNQHNNSMKLIQNVESNESQAKPFCCNLPYLMQGNRRFINFCDFITFICEYICCCCCDFGGVVSYFKDMIRQMQTLKMLMIRINSHDNLILHLYYDKLIKLPLRIGTLDFFKINKNRPDLDDTVRQASEVVNELCETIQVNPQNKRQLLYRRYSKSTIQLSSHRCKMLNKQTKQQQQKPFFRVKFISYTKWRNYRHKYIIEYAKDVNKQNPQEVEWNQVEGDFVDLDKKEFDQNKYKLLLRFTYQLDKLVTNTFLLDLRTFQNMPQNQPHARATFQINFKEIGSARQKIKTINLVGFIPGQVIIKSYYLPRYSRYCSNLDCKAVRLNDTLMEEKVGVCFECQKEYQFWQREKGKVDSEHIKDKIIAMQCPSCKKNYCLHCKISHFIVRQAGRGLTCPKSIDTQKKEQAYKFSYSPLVTRIRGYEDAIKNTCLYCEKYSYKLLHEEGITEGLHDRNAFLGLRMCETCSLYIPA